MDHPSSSTVQQQAEAVLSGQAERVLGVRFCPPPPALDGLKLDAFAEGDVPLCGEIFAHIGPSKPGQQRKLSHDMTKLLLAERRLRCPCRKVIMVCDEKAVAHLKNGWQREFADEFGIQVLVVEVGNELRRDLLQAQGRQYR